MTVRHDDLETAGAPSSSGKRVVASRPFVVQLKSVLNSTPFMALCLAAFCGLLVNWGNQGINSLTRGGYTAGTSDLYVLSPEGMRWADPTRFVGDFFIDNAPQPHWFFDIVTYVGSVIGHLSATYFVYWVIGLVFFGFSTAFLAKAWAPRISWIAAISFTVVLALAPWDPAGTGSTMIAAPIPAVVGGNAAVLFCAALLTGRRKTAYVFAIVTAILHVQQGFVVTLILVVLLVWELFVRKSFTLFGTLCALAAIGVVWFGLTWHSFGGEIKDFVQVCDQMIPYHCAAYTWSWQKISSSIALILLAGFTVWLVGRKYRAEWMISIGLAAFGLLLGLMADVWRIPAFGELAEVSNIYRLGALLLPFAIWGMLAFLIRPIREWRYFVVLLIWVALVWVYLGAPGWQLGSVHSVWVAGALTLATLVSSLRFLLPSIWGGRLRSGTFAAIGTVILTMGLLVPAVVAGEFTVRAFDIGFIPDRNIRAWGQAAQRVIPPGQVVLSAPNAPYIRLATSRGNIGDCKSVPYGGKPWRMWKSHMDDLGGWKQCTSPFPAAPFNNLTAAHLTAMAHKYHVHYLVLEEGQLPNLPGLEHDGWQVIMRPINSLQNYVLRLDETA